MAVNRSHVAVALGANLESTAGKPAETLRAALDGFAAEGLLIRKSSTFYANPCFPKGKGPDYVNAVVLCETSLLAEEVLAALHRIEARFGRVRSTRWAGRTLDLDLLYFDQIILPNEKIHEKWRELELTVQELETPDQLLLPHPRLQDRAFVLIPLAEVDPDWVHPALGKTVVQMRDALPLDSRAEVVAL